MEPFIGEASATVDDKNRLTLPKKFRNLLNPRNDDAFTIYFMPGFDGSDFVIMDAKRADKILERFEELQPGPSTTNRAKRLASMIERIEVDKAGRALLPATLLARRKIDEREFVISGASDYLEVFAKSRWEAHCEAIDDLAVSELWNTFQHVPAEADKKSGAEAVISSTSAK